MADSFSKAKIKAEFKRYLQVELKQYVKPYSILEPDYYMIIGACMPKDNLLLKFNNDKLPEKLQKLIDGDYMIKYFLKEKDIKIDLVKFNDAIIELFDELFANKKSLLRMLGGNDYKNVFFIKHSKLDCYSMFKTIKYIYGKSNCWNIHKEKLYDVKSPIIAINDVIDKYVHNKIAMNKSKEFKQAIEEVKQFINEQMKLENI